MADPVNQFSPSSLVKDLHSFPHWTFNFHSYSNTSGANLDFSNKDYLESLSMWTGIAIVCSGVVLAASLVVMCCVCGSSATAYERIRKPRHRCCLSFFSVILFLSAVTILILNSFLSKSMDSAYDRVKDIQNNYNDAANGGRTTADYLTRAGEFADNAASGSQQACRTDAGDLRTLLSTMSDRIDDVVSGVPVLNLNSQINYDNLQNLQMYFTIAVYSFNAFLVVLSVLLISRCCRTRSRCLVGFLTALVFFLVFLIYTIFGAHVSAMVGAGDACYDPYSLADSYLNDIDNVDYYIYCDFLPFPYQTEFDEANAQLQQALTAYNKMTTDCPDISVANMAKIQDSLTTSQTLLDTLKANVSCTSTHNDMVSLLNSLCSDSLQRVTIMEGFVSLELIALSVCLFALIFLYQATTETRGYYDLEDSESSPLLQQMPPNNYERPTNSRVATNNNFKTW